MPRDPQFLKEFAAATFESASVAILPVPYGETVSYVRGTEKGPAAIIETSRHMELYDEQLGMEPCECGVWTDSMLEIAEGASSESVLDTISDRFGRLLDAGKWVVMLGGAHSITPAGVSAAASRNEGLHLVQLDAHADLRDSYEGERHSHACAMARCLPHAPIRAIGIRSYSPEEAKLIESGLPGYDLVHAWEMEGDGWIERALAGLRDRPVYLTFDIDYFDPAVMPSTGTPEPGGGHWWPTMRLLQALFDEARVVACDVVELAPQPGLHHADFTAARLVYKLIGFACKKGFSGPA
jgi:agmatinase